MAANMIELTVIRHTATGEEVEIDLSVNGSLHVERATRDDPGGRWIEDVRATCADKPFPLTDAEERRAEDKIADAVDPDDDRCDPDLDAPRYAGFIGRDDE